MRNKIFGGIGIVWGALILVNWIMHPPAGAGAYQVGTWVGAAMGLVLLVAGIYYFRKKPTPKQD